jgi:ATP-dependent DNA helicase RecQ
MSYGLQDVVNQRRMIDESPAGEDFKSIMRGKLDALLTLAESIDCRRVQLLRYFGEDCQQFSDEPPLGKLVPAGGGVGREATSAGAKFMCGNCDNCLNPPDLWDGTDAARKLLSTIYRVQQHSGISFGAGHIMDILRGKKTEKVTQFGHQAISTFGIGATLSETQLRSVLRQLIANGALNINAAAFNTLQLNDASREVLKGNIQVMLRESEAASATRGMGSKAKRSATSAAKHSNAALDAAGERRFASLKAWRAEVAREHNLPAYVIFHDATLIAIAQRAPLQLSDLDGISGIGAKKLTAYGDEVLRAVR